MFSVFSLLESVTDTSFILLSVRSLFPSTIDCATIVPVWSKSLASNTLGTLICTVSPLSALLSS